MILAADKNIEHTLNGLLERHRALGIRAITWRVLVHMNRDPGCLQAAEFLRMQQQQWSHALVVFDREGCGQEKRRSRDVLETDIEQQLTMSGWADRAAVVVLDPEIECWVWSPSPHVDDVLGWKDRQRPSLREWLRDKGYLSGEQKKPTRPKEALEAAVRESRVARSSSIYEQIASRVSFEKCTDPAFAKLRAVLTRWFG